MSSFSYDVFVSYIGEDTQSFASHLYASLQRKQVSVFVDHNEIPFQMSLQAVEQSRISIILFSKYYASSTKCMEELEKTMECHGTKGQMVFPVFYGVDPSDVHHQKGVFGEAFEDLINKISGKENKVLSYRTALSEAANIEGLVTDRFSNDGDHLKNIVEHVTSLLDSKNLFVAKHLVGIQSRVKDVIQLLDYKSSDDVRLVVIWGIGGIGKTTIAKVIYNQINHYFDVRKFLPNISETCETTNNSLVSLQEWLLSGICQTTKLKIHNTELGAGLMKETFCHKKVLLVLDSVNDVNQLYACGSPGWFGQGSRIIITARDKNMFSRFVVDCIYDMKPMNFSDSIKLFSWHAFSRQATAPMGGFVELYRKLVPCCWGVPLALTVLGSQLFGRSIEEWKSTLDKLKRHHPTLENVVKISYDLCDRSVKEIFLEIACFFIGMDRDDVIEILDKSTPHKIIGLKLLEQKSLITVDENNKVGMHVLLQDMGREIVHSQSNHEPKIYDVFSSFRGKDIRGSFISHLHSSLLNAGIHVFKDDLEIQRGEQISVSLLEAIRKSSISVIVLSTNYANSKWCMLELENIMESRKTMGLVVVPVFYNVDPSEVRNQTGLFGQAFEDLIKRMSMEEDKVQRWRKALLEVGGIAGFVVLESRNESDDINKVVEHINRLLDRTDLFVAKHPVGVASRMQDVIKLLNNKQSKYPLLLGIWGMGGIGKTTIAKAVYNEIGRKFEGRSFLLNVRETWEQDNGGVQLQEQLLSDIYKTMRTKINNIESGKSILEQRLGKKRILLVLDDVDKSEQLSALFGSHKWFAPKSVIVITTRDYHLLNVHSADHVLEIKQMHEGECIELFSWHAFKEPSPKKEFARLCRNVIAYARGLPLALEVLGSHLFGRETKEWESVLYQLKSIPNEKVHKKLKISFDGLNSTQKETFLDIVFFFIGMKQSDAITILHGCGHGAEFELRVLVERCLVTVDSNNKLGMHDLLRDMGREIIREESPEPENRSRLWCLEDVHGVLLEDMGTKAIKGLSLKLPRTNQVPLRTRAFKKMKRLRLLQLACVQLDRDIFKYLSRDLRWLCWHGFHSKYIPADFDQESLVAIDLKYSNLRLMWKKEQVLGKLKILNLSHSHYLTQTPDFLNLPNLEQLIIKDCPSLTSISHTIGHLNKLIMINLKDCTSLRELPRSIYKLKTLKTLILSGCLKIEKLEEDIEQMESLTTLKAENSAVTRVPYSIVKMKNIAYISYIGHEGFRRDVAPSIIWSWTSPRNKVSSLVPTSMSMPCPISLDASSSNFHSPSFASSEFPNVQSVGGEYSSKLQIIEDVAMDALNVTNYKEWEAMPTPSQDSRDSTTEPSALIDCHISRSKNSSSFLLIRMGTNYPVIKILEESISQKLAACGPGDFSLPGNKNPDWLNFSSKGCYVKFDVPQVNGRNLKTMMLCLVYSCPPTIVTSEGFEQLLIINFTKATTQIYDQDALTSFEDQRWQSIISNLEPGDKVQIVVIFGYGFTVNKTAIYLIYDESIEEKMEHCHARDIDFIVSAGDDLDLDNNINVFSGDKMAAEKHVSFSVDDDMLAKKNENVSSVVDVAPKKNFTLSSGDDLAINKNVTVSSGKMAPEKKSHSCFRW